MELNLEIIAASVVLVCFGMTNTSKAQTGVPEWYTQEMQRVKTEFNRYGITQAERPLTSDGETLLHVAAGCGLTEDINWLIGTCHCFVDVHTKNHLTPLHSATIWNQLHAIATLCRWGANIHADDDTSESPLFYCIIWEKHESRGSYEQAIEQLLLLGANPNVSCPPYFITPLHMATRYDKINMVRSLLEYGANPNVAMNDETHTTPLDFAIRHKNVAMVELLLRYHAYPSPMSYAQAKRLEECDEKEAILELLSRTHQAPDKVECVVSKRH